MSRIPLNYHTNVLFYTKYTHPTLICGGTDTHTHRHTDGQKIFTQYSGISSYSQGSTYKLSGVLLSISAYVYDPTYIGLQYNKKTNMVAIMYC